MIHRNPPSLHNYPALPLHHPGPTRRSSDWDACTLGELPSLRGGPQGFRLMYCPNPPLLCGGDGGEVELHDVVERRRIAVNDRRGTGD